MTVTVTQALHLLCLAIACAAANVGATYGIYCWYAVPIGAPVLGPWPFVFLSLALSMVLPVSDQPSEDYDEQIRKMYAHIVVRLLVVLLAWVAS